MEAWALGPGLMRKRGGAERLLSQMLFPAAPSIQIEDKKPSKSQQTTTATTKPRREESTDSDTYKESDSAVVPSIIIDEPQSSSGTDKESHKTIRKLERKASKMRNAEVNSFGYYLHEKYSESEGRGKFTFTTEFESEVEFRCFPSYFSSGPESSAEDSDVAKGEEEIDMQKQKHSHLVVLVHGLIGEPETFDTIDQALRKKYGERILVYAAKNIEGKTRRGIHAGGKRLTKEVLGVMKENPQVVMFSIIGHSLGGLYARYCIGKLWERNFFNKVTPVNFITFASPHLGSRRSGTSMFHPIVEWGTRRMFSTTGNQLLLNNTDGGEPLLRNMADPEREYFKALQQFQYRMVYANVSDSIVPFATSAIQPYNPYRWGEKELIFSSKYPNILAGQATCSNVFSSNPDEKLYAKLENGVNRMLHEIQRENEKKRIEEEKKKKKKQFSLKKPPKDPFHKLDKKGEEMREMLFNLSTLEWNRVGVKFGSSSHSSIVGRDLKIMELLEDRNIDEEKLQKAYDKGLGVVNHLIDHFQIELKSETSPRALHKDRKEKRRRWNRRKRTMSGNRYSRNNHTHNHHHNMMRGRRWGRKTRGEGEGEKSADEEFFKHMVGGVQRLMRETDNNNNNSNYYYTNFSTEGETGGGDSASASGGNTPSFKRRMGEGATKMRHGLGVKATKVRQGVGGTAMKVKHGVGGTAIKVKHGVGGTVTMLKQGMGDKVKQTREWQSKKRAAARVKKQQQQGGKAKNSKNNKSEWESELDGVEHEIDVLHEEYMYYYEEDEGVLIEEDEEEEDVNDNEEGDDEEGYEEEDIYDKDEEDEEEEDDKILPIPNA